MDFSNPTEWIGQIHPNGAWRDSLARQRGGEPSALVVLIELSAAAYSRKDGVCVVPLSALRP